MLYTNEIVFRGHPDKVADQVSDAILDEALRNDSKSRVAAEVLASNNTVFIGGEITTIGSIDYDDIVRSVLTDIGYNNEVKVIVDVNEQSPDIAQGVDQDGAGDIGIMYGYAYNGGENYIQPAQFILQEFSMTYDFIQRYNSKYLPDGKAQITGRYDDNNKLVELVEVIICYQNTEDNRSLTDKYLTDVFNECVALAELTYDIELNKDFDIIFNPTGKFEVGGIVGDAGLTGRKLLIDNYHSFSKVGGGAFSGKDSTKVDRSGAYFARWVAINQLRQHDLDECEVQISYAIGMKEPRSIHIQGRKNGNLISYELDKDDELYKLGEPQNIIDMFNLTEPKFYETAQFGHFGIGFDWEEII